MVQGFRVWDFELIIMWYSHFFTHHVWLALFPIWKFFRLVHGIRMLSAAWKVGNEHIDTENTEFWASCCKEWTVCATARSCTSLVEQLEGLADVDAWYEIAHILRRLDDVPSKSKLRTVRCSARNLRGFWSLWNQTANDWKFHSHIWTLSNFEQTMSTTIWHTFAGVKRLNRYQYLNLAPWTFLLLLLFRILVRTVIKLLILKGGWMKCLHNLRVSKSQEQLWLFVYSCDQRAIDQIPLVVFESLVLYQRNHLHRSELLKV